MIELLVVLAIIGVLIGVVPAALNKLQEGLSYRQVVQGITVLLRTARQQAIMRGTYLEVQFNAQTGMYGLAGESSESLANGIRFELETASVGDREGGTQSIVFLPQGGSTGGSVSILRSGGKAGVRLRVDWLSGLVTQEAL